MEESDDFSGTGNLAPQPGVTSPGRPGDAGGNMAHDGSKCWGSSSSSSWGGSRMEMK